MQAMIKEMIRHKWWANGHLLQAIEQNETAVQDEELRKQLHHILVANRHWLFLTLEKEFVSAEEMQVPDTLERVIQRFQETERLETEWLVKSGEREMDRVLETLFLPGVRISVEQAMVQVCMHSHGHRSQCATRLRALGGTPAATDYILWVKEFGSK
jgi:uncharacterized damage-inducible protein DinB